MARRAAGSAALVIVEGATPLHPEETLFEAMIEGWRRQHAARRLTPAITRARERVVRRFATYTGGWPWSWRSEQLDAWVARGGWAHSTIRGYQGSIALFLDYLCDPRYGWAEACMAAVGEIPTQICHEWNTATHVSEHEGRPERRPLSRDECQAFFDAADHRVDDVARAGRKGFLSAFRDATLFKVIYAWGCGEARQPSWTSATSAPTLPPPASETSAPARSATARPCGAARPGDDRWPRSCPGRWRRLASTS